MTSPLASMIAEHADIEKRLADPAIHNDPSVARELTRRYAELATPVDLALRLESVEGDLEAARELAEQDASFRDEITALEDSRAELASRLRAWLVPTDPDDSRDAILEVKAGAGGEESALFAGDLLRMYLRYAERRGWRTEILDANPSDLGGYRDVSVAVKARGSAGPGQGVFGRLRFEGGVHRVQRVPVTESAGRIHTSAAGVLVLPEAADVDVDVDPNDLRIDVFRSSGPGGQSVNTTDSAVRITHLPTGVVVSCQNEKSQLQNKESAMRILRSRLLAAAREKAESEAAAARASQVRTVDRSEKIRTYNFPENRISDHRINYKAHNLEQVLDGDLDAVVDALIEADQAARMVAAP
ncbi:peptide chain release factor 1 [Frankia sp. CcI49]|uniref:Peptide chain release factor 1 n=1 Tax=Parafrankia irregularis TaxID=795642 RepID=A0A0S4QN77_9ACTN|nr:MULTISPECIES: peptide chain release factor 1 [Frankiaceae]KPM57324.1 peptide chain release factor 1 [Frankia sp. R43]MBE3205297.1 peptide chain release factor 1 [Parafrankia sp. CH37]ONH53601.1 peptide chain release factor 1 [Frankia sp. CcI49]CUU56494.1 peptide chain release factor 1 [Parafrankia irregularis]